jgi:hypothetical protein
LSLPKNIVSPLGYTLPSEPPLRHVRNRPNTEPPSAIVWISVVFARSAPGSDASGATGERGEMSQNGLGKTRLIYFKIGKTP